MASSPEAWQAFHRLKRLEAELREGIGPFEERRKQAVITDTLAKIRKVPSRVPKEMLESDWASKAFNALRAEWLSALRSCIRFEQSEG